MFSFSKAKPRVWSVPIWHVPYSAKVILKRSIVMTMSVANHSLHDQSAHLVLSLIWGK